MAIDLITGHQGVAHISAEQIANINNALMDDYGVDKVVRLDDGTLTQDGLTINVGTGFWRVNGFDMEIQEAETVYIDPTSTGLSRIDNIYVEILQDIPTGSQRSEIVTVQGEAAASPVAPDAPTAPVLNTDILLQVTPLATVTVTEGAMVMTDLSVAYEMVTPQELAAVETIAENALNQISDIVNVYGAKNLIPYPYYNMPTTDSGVNFTFNEDGSFTANGTATATIFIRFVAREQGSDYFSFIQDEKYIMSMESIGTIAADTQHPVAMWIRVYPASSTSPNVELSRISFVSAGKYNKQFTASYDSITYTRTMILLEIPQGTVLSNVTFKPMLRLASIQDDTYVPYAKTNKELTDTFTDQVANKDDEYSSSKAYKVGEHCIYNNVLYKCVTACSAAEWSVNQNCFEPTTLTTAVTELNSELSDLTKHTLGTVVDLRNYTANNKYTAPCDGYLIVGCAGTSGDYTYGYADGVQLAGVSAPSSGSLTGYDTASVLVKKGMGLFGACNNYTKQGAFVKFIPLT